MSELNRVPTPYTFRRGDSLHHPIWTHVQSHPLSDSLFWLATTVCAVAQLAIIRAALSGRTPGAVSSTASRIRELFWVFLPAVLLTVVLTWTWESLPDHQQSWRPSTGVDRAPVVSAP